VHGKRFNARIGSQLGYLPEERGLYKKESVLSSMTYFGRLKGLSAAAARKWSLDYLERVGLGDKAKSKVEQLSGGQQQKIQLGVTIMNRPGLLILDEPTKGFDPVNRRLLMDILEELSTAGTTTVLVTHQMEEVERLCDRVMLLKDGRRRLFGTVDEVKSEFGSEVISISYTGRLPTKHTLFSAAGQGSGRALLTPNKDAKAAEVFAALAHIAGLKVTRFELQQPSLDDIFVRIYSEKDGAHA
jgi:ABC-2 type transport system ATP-binding protein